MSLDRPVEPPGPRPSRRTTIALIIASGFALGLGVVVAVFVASGPQKETITKTTTTESVSTFPTTITVTTTRTISQVPDAVERALRRLRRLAGPGGGPLPLP